MKNQTSIARRGSWQRGCLWMMSCAVLCCWAGVANAQNIVRVEEDWELVMKTPDRDLTAPQITCTMSPSGNVDDEHVTLEINHQTLPQFAAGGLKLLLWHGDELLDSHRQHEQAVLQTPDEIIRWTQVMKIENGTLSFEIINGTSNTWGDFGGNGEFRVSTGTNLPNMNGYRPEISVENSSVGFAANRVLTLKIARVRMITADGITSEDTTARFIEGEAD